MLRSWKIGSAFGIKLYIHWSFLLLPLYVMFVAHRGKDVYTGLFLVTGILGAFCCIMLHELGHALMARRFGIATRDITLYPIGGVARMERMSDRPWEEFWIAIAGPAVNVVIVALLLMFFALSGWDLPDEQVRAVGLLTPKLFDYPLVQQWLILIAFMNFYLVVFNMMPAFPLDGGRVLRAILTVFLGHLRATEIAAFLGIVFAGLLILLGLMADEPQPLVVIVALFAVLAGQQELAVVRYRAAHGGAYPWDPPRHDSIAMDPSALPPEPNFSGFTFDRRARAWIRWQEGRPVHACFLDQG